MPEPTDRLPTQSTSDNEAQTDKPSAIPQEATGELAGNVEVQNAATDNADNTPRPPVVNEWLASNWPATGLTPVLELVRRDSGRHIEFQLLTLYKNGEGKNRSGTQIEHNGRWHSVPPMSPALSESLILPARAEGFFSNRELFDSIVALLRKHVILPEKECSLLAYWSIATWFPDFVPFIPSVVITGPAAPADQLLRTLVAVCRRPVLLADANPAVLSAIPLGRLSPTLLMREPQLNKRMAALLNASSQPGYLVRSGKDFQEFYCAKCIYLGEQAKNQLLTPNSIHIHVGGTSWKSLQPLPTDDVMQDFQNRLYFYRIIRHDDVAASNFRVAGFRPETRAIAEVLGAVVVRDLELQNRIIELLKERDEQSRVDRASGQAGMVLRAVLWHCHQPDEQRVFVREIAATANQMYSEEGESVKMSSETAGHLLKDLGLYTRRLGSAGRGLVLDKATQARAHELGHANEALPDSVEVPACGHCQKIQVQETQEVV